MGQDFQDYGLLQLLQAQAFNLITTIFVIVTIVLILRSFVNRVVDSDDERNSIKKALNWVACLIFVIALAVFLGSATSMVTNEIPRTGFDRDAVISDAINNEGDVNEDLY